MPTDELPLPQSLETAPPDIGVPEFSVKMDELLAHLHRSNEISGEVRDKLIAELTAGMAILRSPKPDPTKIDLQLKRPLIFIAKTPSAAIISKLATEMLTLLGRLTGLW